MARPPRGLVAIAAALVVALLLVPPMMGRWATAHAESRLSQAVGPGTWEVVGLHPSWGWLVGRVGPVQVQGEEVTLRSDLVLARVQFVIDDVHAWPWGVTSIGTVHYSVDVRAQDLNDRIRHSGHADILPRLTLSDGHVQVQAEERHLHIAIPGLSVTGTVRVAEGVEVDFVADALQVGHLRANHAELDMLSKAINPLLDTRTLPFQVTIRMVSIGSDTLHVDGEAHPWVGQEIAPRPL